MFRVVAVDNLARETVSDIHIVYLHDRNIAKQVADLINSDAGPQPNRWCVVRPAEQPLYEFQP